MDTRRWTTLRRLFESASELSIEERSTFLDRECGGDAALRDEVERMLAVDDDSRVVLDDSPVLLAQETVERASPHPHRVGTYEVVRPIASGGMGVVYEAEQKNPSRRVALKMLRSGVLSDSIRRRFLYEAEVLGRLRHPGIAQVYEAGVHTEIGGAEAPFFAMEFVSGARDLLSYAEGEGLDLRRRLELFAEVCDAVQHGHQRGVVHRDLKPANLLVDNAGRPKVIDFGVARITDADLMERSLATQTGEIVGTLRYMSPEQLGGEPSAIDTRTDVYALGYVLYELVCGAPPYDSDGRSFSEVVTAIRDVPPVDPRRRHPGLPADVAWVALRALEKEPDRRYASASELAADVRRILEHEPVAAGPPSGVYRVRKFVRRHALAVSASAAVLAALAVGAAGTTVGLVRALDAEERSRDEATRAGIMNTLLLDTLYAPQPTELGAEVQLVDVLRRAEYDPELLRDHPAVEAQFNRIVGSGLLRLGDVHAARARLELALSRAEEGEGPDAETTILNMRELAVALVGTGERERAAELFEEARARAAACLGEDHHETLLIEARRAERLPPIGTEERLSAMERVHARCVEALGAHSGTTLYVQRKLALELEEHGRFEEASALVEAVVEHEVAGGSARRFMALDARRDLARLRLNAGDAVRAEQILDETVPEWEQCFGLDSPVTAAVMLEQVSAKKVLRKTEEAKAILQTLLDRRLARFGSGDPHNVSAMAERADVCLVEGDVAGGLEWSDRAAAAAIEALGLTEPRTIAARTAYGRALLLSGEDERGADALLALVEEVDEAHGEDSIYLIDALTLLGIALMELDRDVAVEASERTVAIARRSMRPGSPSRTQALIAHGFVLMQIGALEEAESILVEALDATREYSVRPDLQSTALYGLVRVHTATGDLDSAAAYQAELDASRR
ncbi:MAG: serine/threonine-protein kinase [Planctomycetota bacterium]